MSIRSPLLLVILDGWGYNPNNKYNAIAQANTPQWDKWWSEQAHILLEASGIDVGLPELQMGNSEVGHMHIGAGRIIQQDFTRINENIRNGDFFENSTLVNTISNLKTSGKSLHIMGLFSSGGVHSHQEHLFALLKLCNQYSFNKVCLHLFLDGRDVPPQSVLANLAQLDLELKKYPVGKVVSLSGRSFAMDRDNRWDRIEKVYNLLTLADSEKHFQTAREAVEYYYSEALSDEFIPPCSIGTGQTIEEGDGLLFFNYRSDRTRQLTASFIEPDFKRFERKKIPHLSVFLSMTEYDKKLASTCIFPPQSLTNTLGQVLSKQGLKQLRIAETEKYAHVTFFFNGGVETALPNEERILIPSPKVHRYDETPEMSAVELTDKLIDAINDNIYDVIICNYANADMVGHTGNFSATLQAIECLDQCLQRVGNALVKLGGQMLITADHGNAEEMFDDSTQQAHTAHTSEPVPLLYVGKGWHFEHNKGSLTDIAPTMLRLLNLELPQEMTGRALLAKNNDE